jgi:hypothetical protein
MVPASLQKMQEKEDWQGGAGMVADGEEKKRGGDGGRREERSLGARRGPRYEGRDYRAM